MSRRRTRSSSKPADATPTADRRRRLIGAAALLLLAAGLAWLISGASRKPAANPPREQSDIRPAAPGLEDGDRFAMPEIAAADFRNASPTVGYVGNRKCVECHRAEHESYLQTTHSRSLGDVDVSREPPDGEFFHELSGRHYRVYRQDKTLRLREFVENESGGEVVLTDCAARFSLGSGNYARMYLVEVDDFLIEAPMTWYPRRNVWGMSAGYEKNPHQPGFSREIDSMCLYCHAGKVDAIDGAALRLNVVEMAIGCERCHGPGELHVKERMAAAPIRGAFDDSIVNLRRLSRERQEDVCSQCHLSGLANVNVRGRSKADFRPGLRMSDFAVSFRVDQPESSRTVSGQIQQMRMSRCYRESKTMTCATCHNPHALPDQAEKVEYYRGKCLGCHQSESCGVAVAARREQQPQDNCAACHMPRGPTDIPHLSFTHHCVGIHSGDSAHEKLTEADRLVPIGDVSHLPDHERRRLLGLANDMFAARLLGGLDDETRDDPAYRALSPVFLERGRQILEEVQSQGVQDPEIQAFFSRLSWRKDPAACVAYAESALRSKPISPATRNAALYDLASTHFDARQYGKALPYLQELTKLERSDISLMLLAICHQRQGNVAEAVRLINAAIADSPARADLHAYLASVYRSMGQAEEAEAELERARLLSRTVPQPNAAPQPGVASPDAVRQPK